MAPAPICQDCGAKSIVKGQILPPLARATTCHLPAPCHRAAPPCRNSNFVFPRFALPFVSARRCVVLCQFIHKSAPNLLQCPPGRPCKPQLTVVSSLAFPKTVRDLNLWRLWNKVQIRIKRRTLQTVERENVPFIRWV